MATGQGAAGVGISLYNNSQVPVVSNSVMTAGIVGFSPKGQLNTIIPLSDTGTMDSTLGSGWNNPKFNQGMYAARGVINAGGAVEFVRPYGETIVTDTTSASYHTSQQLKSDAFVVDYNFATNATNSLAVSYYAATRWYQDGLAAAYPGSSRQIYNISDTLVNKTSELFVLNSAASGNSVPLFALINDDPTAANRATSAEAAVTDVTATGADYLQVKTAATNTASKCTETLTITGVPINGTNFTALLANGTTASFQFVTEGLTATTGTGVNIVAEAITAHSGTNSNAYSVSTITVADITGFAVGDDISIGAVPCVITSISGNVISYTGQATAFVTVTNISSTLRNIQSALISVGFGLSVVVPSSTVSQTVSSVTTATSIFTVPSVTGFTVGSLITFGGSATGLTGITVNTPYLVTAVSGSTLTIGSTTTGVALTLTGTYTSGLTIANINSTLLSVSGVCGLYSPSATTHSFFGVNSVSQTVSSVTAATSVFTVPSVTGFTVGSMITFGGSAGGISGITLNTPYLVIAVSGSTLTIGSVATGIALTLTGTYTSGLTISNINLSTNTSFAVATTTVNVMIESSIGRTFVQLGLATESYIDVNFDGILEKVYTLTSDGVAYAALYLEVDYYFAGTLYTFSGSIVPFVIGNQNMYIANAAASIQNGFKFIINENDDLVDATSSSLFNLASTQVGGNITSLTSAPSYTSTDPAIVNNAIWTYDPRNNNSSATLGNTWNLFLGRDKSFSDMLVSAGTAVQNLFARGLEQIDYNVMTSMLNVCELRKDMFAIFDGVDEQRVDIALSKMSGIGGLGVIGRWGAIYDGRSMMNDTIYTMLTVEVVKSIEMAQIIVQNTKQNAWWIPPAGFVNGSIPSSMASRQKYVRDYSYGSDDPNSDIAKLYDASINPTRVTQQGTVMFGEKTMQRMNSALNRLHAIMLVAGIHRRFFNYLDLDTFILNTTQLRNNVQSDLQAKLDAIKTTNPSGLYYGLVTCNDTNNTGTTEDLKELIVDVTIQPTQDSEFIKLRTTVQRTGADKTITASIT